MVFAYAHLIQSLVHICKARHQNPGSPQVSGLFAMDFRDARISPTVCLTPTCLQISGADFFMRYFPLLITELPEWKHFLPLSIRGCDPVPYLLHTSNGYNECRI